MTDMDSGRERAAQDDRSVPSVPGGPAARDASPGNEPAGSPAPPITPAIPAVPAPPVSTAPAPPLPTDAPAGWPPAPPPASQQAPFPPPAAPASAPPPAAPLTPPGTAAGQPPAFGDQASDVARQAIETIGAQGRTVLSRLDPTGWRPTLVVGGILLAIVFGTQLVNAALPTPTQGPGLDPAPAPGTPIEVAPGVRIYPQPGWIQEAAGASRLRKGPIALDVNVQSQSWPDPGTLYQAYVQQVLSQGASQLSATPGQVVQVSGGAAVQGTYVGTFQQVQQPVEGQLTAVIVNGRAIVFDAWSVQGQLGQGLHEVSLMIGTVEVAP